MEKRRWADPVYQAGWALPRGLLDATRLGLIKGLKFHPHLIGKDSRTGDHYYQGVPPTGWGERFPQTVECTTYAVPGPRGSLRG